MKKLTKLMSLSLALIILLGILIFSITQSTITGKLTEEYDRDKNYNYTYTKAICNETYCQDYEIVCNNNTIVDIKPITGAIIQTLPNWKDPRDKERINGFCNISLKE